MAVIARMTRSSMPRGNQADYVRTARAKGSDRLVLVRHIPGNVMIPWWYSRALLRQHAGGVVITGPFFNPGLGRLIVDAIRAQDYPVVQGGVLFFALCVGIVNLVVDLLYAALDPRIKAQYRAAK